MTRCNPYGYATDAGPKHLMGGFYSAAYAGKMTTLADGIHGPAVCEDPATVRARMVCEFGHAGPVMDLCVRHARELQARMSDTCTRCVWPGQARGINESMEYVMVRMAEARARQDQVTLRQLGGQLGDLQAQMNDLWQRGIIKKVPLTLVEVSLWGRSATVSRPIVPAASGAPRA